MWLLIGHTVYCTISSSQVQCLCVPEDGSSQLCSSASTAHLHSIKDTAAASDGTKCSPAENQYNVSGSASLHIIESVFSIMWHRWWALAEKLSLKASVHKTHHLHYIYYDLQEIGYPWVFSVILIMFTSPSCGDKAPVCPTSLFTVPLILATPHSFFVPPQPLSPALPSLIRLNGGWE